jgi:ABC-2 type transport system ATP-binding protein
MIEVRNLTRIFRTYKKAPGFWGGVKGLFKRDFEDTAAAKDVSFSIAEGEFVGFLGPNGAGKTTTLKMLSGLIFPTSGTARVAGFDPTKRENAYRRLFAIVLGQKNQLWWDLPAIESFHLLRAIYAIPAEQFKTTLDELVLLLDVEKKLNVMVRELSLGERMKMELIAALLHRPRVLFLDEPTIGLDVISQKAVRSFLREYNRKHRVTILLTSHYMDETRRRHRQVYRAHAQRNHRRRLPRNPQQRPGRRHHDRRRPPRGRHRRAVHLAQLIRKLLRTSTPFRHARPNLRASWNHTAPVTSKAGSFVAQPHCDSYRSRGLAG